MPTRAASALVPAPPFCTKPWHAAPAPAPPAGIFGMNLTSGLERWDPYALWGVSAFGLALGLGALTTAALYVKRQGLLFLPSFGLHPGSGG